MKVRNLSKKTLAILLSLTMLMSCMVWSGVSAATTLKYSLDFDTNTSAVDEQMWGIFKNAYSNATMDVSTATGTLNKTVRGVNAIVSTTDETDHKRVMKMSFYDPAAQGLTDLGVAGSVAGFRFCDQGTKVSVPGKTKYLFKFQYKIVDITVPVDIRVTVGSTAWIDVNPGRPHDDDELGTTFTLTTEDEKNVWKTGYSYIYVNSGQGAHFVLDPGKTATVAERAGTEIWIDNIQVYTDPVELTLNYDDNNATANGVLYGVEGDALSLPTPSRPGYTFEGWFDADGNAATNAFPAASTVYKAKWAESGYDEKVGSTNTLLTFDKNVDYVRTYYTGDMGAGSGQKMTIEDSGDATQGNAVKLTYTTNAGSGNSITQDLIPSLSGFRIADEANVNTEKSTLNGLEVTKGNIYKVTFKYRVDAVSAGKLYFRIYHSSTVWSGRVFNGGKNSYVNADTVITGEDVSSTWGTAKAYVLATDSSWRLHLAVYSTHYDEAKGTTLWIDDVTVQSVTCDDYVTLTRNMDAPEFSDAAAVVGLPDQPLVMEWYDRNGYTFDGWYTDSAYTTKVGNSFPTESGTIYAKWNTKLETYRNGVNVQTFEEADGLSDFILQTDRYTGITTETNHTLLGNKAIYTGGKKYNNSQRQRPRIVLKTGDAKTAENVTVNAGDSVTVSFWVKGNRDMNSTFTFYLATVDAEVAAQAIQSTSSKTYTKANGTTVSDVHKLQALASSNVGKPYKSGSVSTWGVGEEVAQVSLKANTWTYCEATVSSIVLHGTDTNYLTLGYNYTGSDDDNTWALYLDDIAVNVTSSQAEENVQSFEDMTAGRTNVAANGTAYIVENGTTYTDSNKKSHTLTVQTISGKKSMLAHLNYWGGDDRTQVPVYGADGNQYRMKKGHVYDVSFKFMVPYSQDSALTYVHNTAQAGKVRNTITLNYWLMGSASAATKITGHGNAEYMQANEVYAAGMWYEVSARFVCKNGEYLMLGISDNAYMSANTAIFIDDMKVVEVPLDNTVSAWVQADDQYGTTETNLAFKVDDGNGGMTEKSFMRIGATYTTDDATNFSTVLIGGKAYTIKQRGVMLGEKGADMYLTKQEDGSYVANNVIGSTAYSGTMSEQYWIYDEENQTVSYTMAVTFSATSKDRSLATRSYMVVDYNGQDAIMYTDTIDTVTVNGEAKDLSGQSIYESACELNNTTYGWFTE